MDIGLYMMIMSLLLVIKSMSFEPQTGAFWNGAQERTPQFMETPKHWQQHVPAPRLEAQADKDKVDHHGATPLLLGCLTIAFGGQTPPN